MARRTTVGIDVGTYHIKVVIAEHAKKGRGVPTIIGAGCVQSKGLHHGYIVNAPDAVRSIRAALNQAEKTAGISIKRAYVSVGGVGLEEVRGKGEVIISRADLEVTDLDINHAIEDAEEKVAQKIVNRKIIHAIPIEYRIDGQTVLGRPKGMRGAKLEVEMLFITALEQHVNDLIAAVEETGVSVVDVMAAPIAASFVTLSKAQKMAGCILANIGAETVSIAVFENNIPFSIKIFPIGSTDITNDIALGLRVSLEEAEDIKLGKFTSASYPKKKLDEIIVARLSDIFDLIEAHLKSIGKSGLLPAGIILTGGGSGIATIEDLARGILRLPSRRAALALNINSKVRDASWAVAYGLCIWGFSADEETAGISVAKRTGNSLVNFIKQFLP